MAWTPSERALRLRDLARRLGYVQGDQPAEELFQSELTFQREVVQRIGAEVIQRELSKSS